MRRTRIIRLQSVLLLNPERLLRRPHCLSRQRHSRVADAQGQAMDAWELDENSARASESKGKLHGARFDSVARG